MLQVLLRYIGRSKTENASRIALLFIVYLKIFFCSKIFYIITYLQNYTVL